MLRCEPLPPSLTPRVPRLLATRAAMHLQNGRVLLRLAIQHRDLAADGRGDHHVRIAGECFRAARDVARFARELRTILVRVVGKRDAAVAIQCYRSGVVQ